MKTAKYQPRFYRNWAGSKKLYRQKIVDKETDLEIFADKPLDKYFISERVSFYRGQIEDYINYKDRRFLVSLKPIEVERTAAAIVREMAEAARQAGVGPMAAVAGALAEFLGKDLLNKGYKEIIIENGGDIFLSGRQDRILGVYCGPASSWKDLRLKIRPQGSAIGICTSSGTIGHSLSFGKADSVVIIAKNAIIADAVATAVCNRTQAKDKLEEAVLFARSISSVSGGLIVLGNNLAGWGKIEFVR